MPARGLAGLAIAFAFAIAACSEPSSPVAIGSDISSLTAHRSGGDAHDDRGKGGRDDHDRAKKHGDDDHDDHKGGECQDDDHGRKHGHHAGQSGKRSHGDRHWSKGDHDDRRWGKKHGHHADNRDDSECDGGGSGGATTGTISGTVSNTSMPASGYPVSLLNAAGTMVIASTNTASDGTGSYSFLTVQPGAYLVCETDPNVLAWGFLVETTPSSGNPACPTGYALFGYLVTVTPGLSADGNSFVNSNPE